MNKINNTMNQQKKSLKRKRKKKRTNKQKKPKLNKSILVIHPAPAR